MNSKTLRFEDLPEFVKDKLRILQQHTGLGLEDILSEYSTIYFDPFVQNDPTFADDLQRHSYSIKVLLGRLYYRPPARDFDVIPVGIRGKRVSRSGNVFSVIYAITNKNPRAITRIVLRNEVADDFRSITLFAKYRVKLAELRGGDLIGDYRTKWVEPRSINIEPLELMKSLGIRKVTIRQIPNNLSRKTSTGFVDDTDWRWVQGVIIRKNMGTRDDGTEWGVYTIVDDDITGEEVRLDDGSFLMFGLTAWTHPILQEFDVESECHFFGVLRQSKSELNPYVMDCFLVLPVHAKRVDVEVSE